MIVSALFVCRNSSSATSLPSISRRKFPVQVASVASPQMRMPAPDGVTSCTCDGHCRKFCAHTSILWVSTMTAMIQIDGGIWIVLGQHVGDAVGVPSLHRIQRSLVIGPRTRIRWC